MKFSLLYQENEALQRRSGSVAADLLLDRLVTAFEPSAERAENFLRVVTLAPRHGSQLYRQAILRDFMDKPQLLDDLREMLKSYDGLRKDWQELRTSLGTYASLKATAEFTRATLTYFTSIREVLEEHAPLSSEGLTRMSVWLLEMSQNRVIAELNEIAELFKADTLSGYEWELHTRFDDALTVSSVSVASLSEIVETSFLKRMFTKKTDDGSIDLGEFHAEEAKTLLSKALYELYYALTAVAGGLYEIFRGLSEELDFYTTALKLFAYLREHEMSCIFPVMSTEAFDCAGLYDPLLLVEGLSPAQIVTNDFAASGNLLIRGVNAAGKTSILRAIGIATLFANAGLPVCADKAVVPAIAAVYAQFSKAEQLTKLDEAGRFEQEVQELAEIVRSELAESLVLLNETFQTTSYAEGSDAVKPILRALERSGARWIFVTHLTPLLNAVPEGSVTRVMDNYRLT